MAKIKIGNINGRNIYVGNPNELRDGEYYISMNGNIPDGFFVKSGGELNQICSCGNKNSNLQEIEILNGYHGNRQTITPDEGFDGIGKVAYRKAKLEEKDTIQITKNGITEIKVGKGFDGLDDITIIVNVQE